MLSDNFYIVKSNGLDIIRHHKSFLQIRIHELGNSSFIANEQEVVLYGIGRDNLIGFETVNIGNYDAALVAFALHWYADHIGQPEMFITREDPRVFRLKRA